MANELELRIKALGEAIASDIKALYGQDGNLSALVTTAKNSLVEAINEVASASPTGALLASNNLSDVGNLATAQANLDMRTTAQITSEIASAIATVTLGSLGGLTQTEVDARVELIVGSAPEALDTLNELAAAIGDDANFASTVTTALSNRVRFDAVQTLTTPQRLQACENIGVGNPDRDFVADYTTVRDA